ncbi:MAG TPA: hypothetical protein QF572_11555 [Vicinamibacterales bacterium]|nr:hypothetical protein [Vicinamibacterales bacterium]
MADFFAADFAADFAVDFAVDFAADFVVFFAADFVVFFAAALVVFFAAFFAVFDAVAVFRLRARVGGAGSLDGSILARLVRNFLTVLSSNCIRVKASSTAITDPRPYVGSCTLDPTSKRFILNRSSRCYATGIAWERACESPQTEHYQNVMSIVNPRPTSSVTPGRHN